MGNALTPTVLAQLFSLFYESDWSKTTETCLPPNLVLLMGDIAVSNCFVATGCSTVPFANGEFIMTVSSPPLAKLARLV